MKGWIMGLQVRKYRNYNDFVFGSFIVYATEKECIVRGKLKKTKNYSPYLLIIER